MSHTKHLCYFEYALTMYVLCMSFSKLINVFTVPLCDVSPGETPSEMLPVVKEVRVKFHFFKSRRLFFT